MKLPADRQLLYICRKIAAVMLALFFVEFFYGIVGGWFWCLLNFPEPITDTVPSSFPVIVKRTTASEGGMGSSELVRWEEWERRQRQGAAYVWVENGAGEGELDRGSRRPLFYTYRMTELAPQRYMVHVTVTDRDDMEERAQYRVEGNHVIPLTFGYIHASIVGGIGLMVLVVTVLFFWSLRAFLRRYTRYTGGEKEIRELLSQARLTLSMLVGYYMFLAILRASRLVWQRS